MKRNSNYWFIAFFIFTLVIPIYGGFLEEDIVLSGVTSQPEKVEASIATINDGTYQTYLNSVWENAFPGRKVLLKVRNQLLYSVFNVSPNENVVIGKEDYLFEPMYILLETKAYPPSAEEYFDKLGSDLKQLKELIEANNKELYVFITPSKAHFCKDKIPDKYMFLDCEDPYTYTNYSKLIDELDKNKINYFDSVSFIENYKDSGILESPVFYASGIHWNHTWGVTCAARFLEYMDEHSKFDLNLVSVNERTCDEPVAPDTDLYSSLNLIFKPKEQWYSANIEIVKEGKDKPNVFFRGGSFMGQSLNAIVENGTFGKDVYFENNYYFLDRYTSSYQLSGFTAYNELDLDKLVGQSDIVVLEVNEGAIYTMSWGFIEHLLDHPEYLDYDTKNDVGQNSDIKWGKYNVRILDSTETQENPWGYTAGIIDVEGAGECVFLNPNTSIEVKDLSNNDKFSVQAQIHPWVREASDGLGIVIWLMDDSGDILKEDRVFVENDDDWVNIDYSLSEVEGVSKIRILCNNGKNNDDSADWAIINLNE